MRITRATYKSFVPCKQYTVSFRGKRISLPTANVEQLPFFFFFLFSRSFNQQRQDLLIRGTRSRKNDAFSREKTVYGDKCRSLALFKLRGTPRRVRGSDGWKKNRNCRWTIGERGLRTPAKGKRSGAEKGKDDVRAWQFLSIVAACVQPSVRGCSLYKEAIFICCKRVEPSLASTTFLRVSF